MAKEEPKFRVLRLALSNDAFETLEIIARNLKLSKSAVISNLLDSLDSPLDGMERVMRTLERKKLRKRPSSEPEALRIRRQKAGE